MIVTRGTRILGMTILFALPVSLLVEHWKYAEPAMIVAVITGIFAGEAWHRWRVGSQSR